MDGAVEVLSSTPRAQIVIFRLGAAVNSIADEDTAFSHRDAEYIFHPILVWSDPAENAEQVARGRRLGERMAPFGTGASYLNFTPERDRVRNAYGAAKYARLVALKDEYDPQNLFRHNQNIAPSRQDSASRVA